MARVCSIKIITIYNKIINGRAVNKSHLGPVDAVNICNSLGKASDTRID